MSLIKNLPALSMRSQITFIAEMLSNSIYDDSATSTDSRTPLLDNWEQVDIQNSARIETALSILFGREVAVFFDGGEFWVYCSDLSDVENTKNILNAYGYKNLSTFIPKVSHPENKKLSIPDQYDPHHAYAIRVNKSESLVFGVHANKWLELNKDNIDLVREHIIFTYCHNTDARFTFSSKLVASVFYTALLNTKSEIEKLSKSQNVDAPKLIVDLSPCRHSIDCWVVSLDLLHN